MTQSDHNHQEKQLVTSGFDHHKRRRAHEVNLSIFNRNHQKASNNMNLVNKNTQPDQHHHHHQAGDQLELVDDTNDEEPEDEEEELLSEALLAVASAEEYAAKIIKLQQACLTPLKEDLADWLNKIMNMSTITTDNFMDKLDNGVIICRLAKVISIWCKRQLTTDDTSTIAPQADDFTNCQQQQLVTQVPYHHHQPQAHNKTTTCGSGGDQTKLDTTYASCYQTKLSTSSQNVHSPTNNTIELMADVETYDSFYNGSSNNHQHQQGNKIMLASATVTPLKQACLTTTSRLSSQSTNCLVSASSTTSLNYGYVAGGGNNKFFDNITRMEQTKIWEDARCRTFYARDNVCNFIRWSKEFGVNQSVLFESDDLVLHANTRQVVLCLLEVARIACVKHGFTEAPGLVKFEQEIDREMALEKAAAIENYLQNSMDGCPIQPSSSDKQLKSNSTANRKSSSLARNSRASIADATDDLIMRYCLHKEEEAARKKAAAELEAVRLKAVEDEENEKRRKAASELMAASEASAALTPEPADPLLIKSHGGKAKEENVVDKTIEVSTMDSASNQTILFEADSLITSACGEKDTTDTIDDQLVPPPNDLAPLKNNLNYDNRVDSLDSGEGRTESASTTHSRTPINSALNRKHMSSSIPIPIKRSDSSSSLISNQTSSMATSELSSSRSSLLSGQDGNPNKRHIASDLDGKVMRIAKSYYGKGAKKGVTRLSEGKYKIADRIVFVRLLKGHRVMVRIGGGWDTLENFLFRHKSDPSQVIDVDNLLPLETKMNFDNSPQMTPTNNKFSKLPYYRRTSSASSTNLSTSNLSVSNHSPTSSSIASTNNSVATNSTPTKNHYTINGMEASSIRPPSTSSKQNIPYLLIHRGQNVKTTPHATNYFTSQLSDHTPQKTDQHQNIYRKAPMQSRAQATGSKYQMNRPLGSSKTPTASATNLYPATLTTRLGNTNLKTMGAKKLNSTTNLHNGGRTAKQEAFHTLGRSNESLQASYYKSPQHHRQHQLQNGFFSNLSARKKIDAHHRSSNEIVRQANSMIS